MIWFSMQREVNPRRAPMPKRELIGSPTKATSGTSAETRRVSSKRWRTWAAPRCRPAQEGENRCEARLWRQGRSAKAQGESEAQEQEAIADLPVEVRQGRGMRMEYATKAMATTRRMSIHADRDMRSSITRCAAAVPPFRKTTSHQPPIAHRVTQRSASQARRTRARPRPPSSTMRRATAS